MANEVIKIITGSGNILSGKLLMFDIFNYTFHIIEITDIPENHKITRLGDYF
jgi:adenylyltransferase/sulfurtransferase